MLQLLTAFPGGGATLSEPRCSKSVLAGLRGGRETVAWMALSRGPWSLRGGGEGGCSAAGVSVVEGGAGRHGGWGPSCISPLGRRERDGRAPTSPSQACFDLWNWSSNLLFRHSFILASSVGSGCPRTCNLPLPAANGVKSSEKRRSGDIDHQAFSYVAERNARSLSLSLITFSELELASNAIAASKQSSCLPTDPQKELIRPTSNSKQTYAKEARVALEQLPEKGLFVRTINIHSHI